MNKPTVTALILAGGKGRRMNFQDKGWISYRDKPLIQHAIDIANPQVDNIVISYNQNEAGYASLPYARSTDIEPGYPGPLMGILSCKKLIPAGFIFVLPCDMPDLPPDIVNRLYSKMGSHDLAVAHDGNRLQPLIFLAKTQLIDSIEHYLEKGNRSVRGWVDSVDYVVVDFASQRAAFWNLNEPSQLQE
jgi:molybdopterin-guanine dinucleotide biosynthesis protein A